MTNFFCKEPLIEMNDINFVNNLCFTEYEEQKEKGQKSNL